VANGELYQGITNGYLVQKAYNKPAFLTWNAYSFMLLSILAVYPYVRHQGWTLRHYFFTVWPGKLGFWNSFLACLVMISLMIALNILWVLGLANVSVSTVNAVFQTQTGITVALSVWILGDRLSCSEGLGISVSMLGVLLLVIPPLCDATDEVKNPSGSKMIGIVSTFGSTVIWAVYQLSWRVLAEAKHRTKLTRMEGMMDTLASVAVMGFCNLVLGWPFILLFHWTGVETFEYPSDLWALTLNGLVEYSFDTSCVIAIFLTSAVVTSITAPLTIPIAFIWDGLMYNEPLKIGLVDVGGVLLVLVGVAMVELKPDWGSSSTLEERRRLLLVPPSDDGNRPASREVSVA
jgi:drug/metabolite transporter (DMT)-like permease